MKQNKKICKGREPASGYGCGSLSYIYAYGLCRYCYGKYYFDTRIKGSKPKRKITGEKSLFDKIWDKRKHVSFISGISLERYISSNRYVNLFAHLLSKKQYPSFRLKEDNIVLLTPREHYLLDNGTDNQRIMYAQELLNQNIIVNWTKLYKKKDLLKIQYKKREIL
jgi:hypothetical protein